MPGPDLFNASTYLLERHVTEGRGDRTALVGPGGTMSYAGLAEQMRHVAAGLLHVGVRPEQRVAMVMSDGPDLVATILAAMYLGAVAVPINTMLTAPELAMIIRDSRAQTVIASPEFGPAVAEALSETREVRRLVLTGRDEVPVRSRAISHFLDEITFERVVPRSYRTWEDSHAVWLYTSGTTGQPKAAMHRHANVRHVAQTYGREVLGITPEDRCYSVAKLFFAYGLGNSLFFPLSVGASVVLDPARPTPALVAERLARYEPTLFFAVPSFYGALLAADIDPKVFASVRLAVSAGEALPAGLYQRFVDRFGVELVDGIGTTEALHIFLSNRPGSVRPGSSGTPVSGYEVKLLDDSGQPVAGGEPGHLFVKGASIALGYWCRTDVTRQVFQGEWLRTGDMYTCSPDGFYTCLGRSNDMIKAGGQWVSPTEVEARLMEHPAVAQAAVVGVQDKQELERPVACVVLAPGAMVSAEELVEFCRAGLAAFKRPRMVLFVAEPPTTATGKIRRFVVRDLARLSLGDSAS